MMSRSTFTRWLAALLLLVVLSSNFSVTVVAQEDGATPAPTVVATSEISIGDDSSTSIAEEATEEPVATEETESESESPTATSVPDGIGDEEGTGVPTGDGSPAADPSATETSTSEPSPEATPTESVEPAAVGVSVTIYNCSSAYAGGDPASDANCSPASGIGVAASTEEGSIGSGVTSGDGVASFDAPEGKNVLFVEDQSTLPSGFVPDGNGSASVTASDGASAVIVNIEVSTAGRLQISSGQCPTMGEERTQFIVVGPLAVQSAALGCAAFGGVSFTVAGAGGSYSVTTDGDGNWIGTLPVGSYTISHSNASAGLEVVSGSTTLIMAVIYVPGPKGTLSIQRYDCADGAEGTTITIGGGPNNESCLPSDQSVSVASVEGGAAPLVIDLGEDGSTSVEVAAGDYVVTDGPTGVSAPVSVAEGETVTATINSTILTGAVSASMYWCPSSVSGAVNPGTWGTWTTGCGRAGAGIAVSLLDADGNVVSTASTGANGELSFSKLLPGTYRLSSSSGCALFANGADARNGFTISAGDVVEISAFGCAEPAYVPEEPSGPGPIPGTIGGGIGNPNSGGGSIGSGDALGNGGGFTGSPFLNSGFHTRSLTMNPLANVSTLPATGEGTNRLNELTSLLLLGLAALAAGAALSLQPRRSKQS